MFDPLRLLTGFLLALPYEIPGGTGGILPDQRNIFLKRMTADIDAKHFLLISKKVFLFKLLKIRVRHLICMLQIFISHIKQRQLTGHRILFLTVHTA